MEAWSVQQILTQLDCGQPAAPFRPTATGAAWTGALPDGTAVVLKRADHSAEAQFYRTIAGRYAVPAPGVLGRRGGAADQTSWLLLESVTCAPWGLSPRSATHWWQAPRRRERLMVALASLHGLFWDRPEALDGCRWLPRYDAGAFWSALDRLAAPPAGWTPLSQSLLGELASSAEMLIAGPATLIHGRCVAEHVGWRGPSAVLLAWGHVAWTTPYADLGRLLAQLDPTVAEPTPICPAAWRHELLATWRAGVEAYLNRSLDPGSVARDARGGTLWELAVDLWRLLAAPCATDRQRWDALLRHTEAVADEL